MDAGGVPFQGQPYNLGDEGDSSDRRGLYDDFLYLNMDVELFVCTLSVHLAGRIAEFQPLLEGVEIWWLFLEHHLRVLEELLLELSAMHVKPVWLKYMSPYISSQLG